MFGLAGKEPLFTFSTENGTYLLQEPSELNDFEGDPLFPENLTKIIETQVHYGNDILRTSLTCINTEPTTLEQEMKYFGTHDIDNLSSTAYQNTTSHQEQGRLLINLGKDTQGQPIQTMSQSEIDENLKSLSKNTKIQNFLLSKLDGKLLHAGVHGLLFLTSLKMLNLTMHKQVLFISKANENTIRIRFMVFPDNLSRFGMQEGPIPLTHSTTPTCFIDTQFELTPDKTGEQIKITAKNTVKIYDPAVMPYLVPLDCFYLSKILHSVSERSASEINSLIQRHNNSHPQNRLNPSFLDLNFKDMLTLARTYPDHFDIDAGLLEKASNEKNAHLIPIHDQQLQMLLNETEPSSEILDQAQQHFLENPTQSGIAFYEYLRHHRTFEELFGITPDAIYTRMKNLLNSLLEPNQNINPTQIREDFQRLSWNRLLMIHQNIPDLFRNSTQMQTLLSHIDLSQPADYHIFTDSDINSIDRLEQEEQERLRNPGARGG